MLPSLDAKALHGEEVARAKAMDPGDRILEGPRLFERACELMKAGIRYRHPDASDEEVLARLRNQLDIVRDLEATHDQR